MLIKLSFSIGPNVVISNQTLEKTEGAIKKGRSIQRHWQYQEQKRLT